MVLEMKAPHGAGLENLFALWPVFISYVLSFIYVAIYWNNHHHFFHLVKTVNGAVLWANMHLLFWLSTVPFATAWMGENDFAPIPTALYGAALLMSAIAWYFTIHLLGWNRPGLREHHRLGSVLFRRGVDVAHP